MADKKISALTAATLPLAGTEVLPLVQGNTTVKVANNDLRPKQIQSNATSGILQVVGPAAASTRVMTTPDANFNVARTDAAQSFTGDQTLSTGNLVIGTAGKGIDFSADPSAAGMTSELLADYEEGTWTPVIIGSSTAGAGTYSLQEGFYTKIGRQVTVTGTVVWSAHTGTGTMRVSGLPYTIKNDNTYSSFALEYGTLTVSALAIAIIVTRPGQTYLQVDETVAGGSSQSGVPVDTAASLYFQAIYFV